MGQAVQHIYFLDKADALTQYEKALEVVYDNDCRLRQFCYYTGSESEPMVSTETPYLVNVPTSKLVSFFQENAAYPIPTEVMMSEKTQEGFKIKTAILKVLADIQKLRDEHLDDAIFTQPVMALWMARQQIKLYKYHEHIAAMQLCYAIGEPPEGEDIPKNLIFLPEQQMVERIYQKSNRPPKILVTSPFDNEGLKQQGKKFLAMIQYEFDIFIKQKYEFLFGQLESIKINFPKEDAPLKVLILASSYTVVMRHAFEGIAQAFRQLGCDVHFVIDDPYTCLTTLTRLEQYVHYQPHITFNINYSNNIDITPETYNFIWWQDLMPEIQSRKPFPVMRSRDFHFAFSDYILEAVREKGVEVQYQEQCADENLYFLPPDGIFRREVIVFVGSAYIEEPDVFKQRYGEKVFQKVLHIFQKIFEQPFEEPYQRSEQVHAFIKSQVQLDPLFLTRLWIYYCRTTIIHQIIESGLCPIELYGFGWQEDPVTAPYYKGTIESGRPLADLYRSVKFGLSVQPFMTGHQRLAEMKFCGATPLVYWTPNRYEHADYQDEVVAFDSIAGLQQQLSCECGFLPDQKIRQHFSYVNFAQRCLDRVYQMQAKELRENNDIGD